MGDFSLGFHPKTTISLPLSPPIGGLGGGNTPDEGLGVESKIT